MSRIRTRTSTGKISRNGSRDYTDRQLITERIQEVYYPGSTPVLHTRLNDPFTVNRYMSNGQEITSLKGWYESIDIVDSQLTSWLSSQLLSQLNNKKLPSSTKFRILQFLAELDDSLLVFTRKFWQSLSYGSFTWGVIPFVNDIKAILGIIKSFSSFLESIDYEDQYDLTPTRLEGHLWHPVDWCILDIERCRVRHTGTVAMGDLGAEKWLDALGFYPDLATFWDLVPLSFVVNWLIPVGSFLESFRGGWVTHISFSGWTTIDIEFTVERQARDPRFLAATWLKNTGTSFRRTFDSRVLEVPPRNHTVELSMPSLTQLMNILYIFVLSKAGIDPTLGGFNGLRRTVR